MYNSVVVLVPILDIQKTNSVFRHYSDVS